MVQLDIHNLTMQFGERLLFAIPSLVFAKGDTIYLQGDNGAGKTTLMKLLAGLIKPTSGYINWHDGNQYPKWQTHPQLGKAIYLHQHPYLFEGNVEYNLRFPCHHLAISSAEKTQRISQAISMAGLEHLVNADAANLSGGERQRLAIARAWVMQPDLLMLDEPISNMDMVSQQLVLKMIQALKQQGTGLLISSHQQGKLTELCQQSWRISQHKIIVSALPLRATNEEIYYVIAN